MLIVFLGILAVASGVQRWDEETLSGVQKWEKENETANPQYKNLVPLEHKKCEGDIYYHIRNDRHFIRIAWYGTAFQKCFVPYRPVEYIYDTKGRTTYMFLLHASFPLGQTPPVKESSGPNEKMELEYSINDMNKGAIKSDHSIKVERVGGKKWVEMAERGTDPPLDTFRDLTADKKEDGFAGPDGGGLKVGTISNESPLSVERWISAYAKHHKTKLAGQKLVFDMLNDLNIRYVPTAAAVEAKLNLASQPVAEGGQMVKGSAASKGSFTKWYWKFGKTKARVLHPYVWKPWDDRRNMFSRFHHQEGRKILTADQIEQELRLSQT